MTQIKGFLSRYFYFCMSLLIAALVVGGFSRTVGAGLFHAAVPRPLLLWIHGAAFASWVVFFIAQSTLVRIHKVSWHRFFGWFGAGLATVMVPLGIATAIIMTRFDTVQLHQSGVEAFMAIPFYDMIAFGVIIALAIYWRKRPEFHRRLVFVATCGLMDAAIDRWPKPCDLHVADQSSLVARDHPCNLGIMHGHFCPLRLDRSLKTQAKETSTVNGNAAATRLVKFGRTADAEN